MGSDIGPGVHSARTIVGEHEASDYLLRPKEHAALFKTSAPDLAALLGMEKPTAIAKQYLHRAGQAKDAQKSFKRTAAAANIAIMISAVTSALLMAAQILSAPSTDGAAPLAPGLTLFVLPLGVISAVAAAVATAALFVTRSGNLLESWMGKRALAETARLAYFSALTSDPKPAALDLLTLEYFRRFQCDAQDAFFDQRGEAHRRSSRRTLWIAVAGVFVSALAGAFGVANVAAGQTTALAAIAVIGAAVSAYAAAREAMTQDSRNAERYDRTLEALRGLVGTRLDDVRAAVAGGDHAPLVEFVSAVNEQLSLEHRQWLESGEATKEGLAKLDAALEAAGKKKEE